MLSRDWAGICACETADELPGDHPAEVSEAEDARMIEDPTHGCSRNDALVQSIRRQNN